MVKRGSAFCLFEEYEEHGEDQAEECCKMVPLQPLPLEEKGYDHGEDRKGDDFLYDFELHEVEGAPLPSNPILFAGTCAQYSKKATPQEKSMTNMSGQLDEIFIS